MNDAEARHTASTDLGHHIFLAAGAGTGKTRVLVDRYMNFLRTGAEVAEIVCVTFTEKAAGELKSRIRNECEQQASTEPGETDLWRRHKRNLESAPISTLHGFCAGLLRENAIAAGIDPRFNIMDGRESTQLKEDISRKFILDRLREDASEDMKTLVVHLGFAPIFEMFHTLLLRPPGPGEEQHQLEPDELITEWEQIRQARLDEEVQQLVDSPAWNEAFGTLQNNEPNSLGCRVAARRAMLLESWLVLSDVQWPVEERASAGRAMLANTSTQHMATSKWDNPVAVRQAMKIIRSLLEKMVSLAEISNEVEESAAHLTSALSRELDLARQALRQAKDAQSKLDFDDLQTESLKLLRSQPEICRRYQEILKALLVDEFQDTDAVQKEILWRLSGLADSGGAGVNMFVVGDAKQSIYRFRGANVSVFNETELEFRRREDAQTLELSKNFRTHQALLEFVNDLFESESVMGTSPGRKLFEAAYSPLEADRSLSSDPPFVECLLAQSEIDEAPLETLRLREADLIAERIRALVEEQPFRVNSNEDSPDSDGEPISWGHFAFLFRAMTNVFVYERALRRQGIPYHVVAGRGLYGRQEVRDLLNFIRTIESDRNEIALAGTLRSPFFGVNDETLFWLCEGRSLSANLAVMAGRLEREAGLGLLANISEAEAEKLRRADRTLRHFKRIKDRLPLGSLIESISTETGFSAALLGTNGGEQKVSNLLKVTELARYLGRSSSLLVDDFIRTVESLVVQEESEGEAPTAEEESDVVKLLTVHKAKGLEWPVVIVPDMARRLKIGERQNALSHPRFGPVVKGLTSKGGANWPWVCGLLAAEEREKEIAEHRRLLYVASTRARDYLILSGTLNGHTIPKTLNWQSWLFHGLWLNDSINNGTVTSKTARDWKVSIHLASTDGESRSSAPKPIQPLQRDYAARPDLAAIKKRLQRFEPDTKSRQRFTVTELAEYVECPQRFYLKRVRDMSEYHWARIGKRGHTLSAAERGSAAHRALEKLVANPDATLDDLVSGCLREQGLSFATESGVVTDICRMLHICRETEVWPLLAESAHVEMEAPFSFVFKGASEDERLPHEIVIEGAIDAVSHQEDGGLVVIDFKTGVSRPVRYRFQIGVYSLALEAAFGKPPAKAILYYLDSGKVSEIDTAGLIQETRPQLHSAAGGILEGRFDRLNEVDCSGCGVFWCCDQRDDTEKTIK